MAEDMTVVGILVNRLEIRDRRKRFDSFWGNLDSRQQQHVSGHQQSGRQYDDNADRILQAWKDAVYADTFEDFECHWQLLCTVFAAQPGK